MGNPKKYLVVPAKMPKKYTIAILGQRQSGKRTLARQLQEKYGWKIIDAHEIIAEILNRQRQMEKHVPSNMDPRSNSIHLSELEFKELIKGGNCSINSLLPMLLFSIGAQLQKKVPVQEELTEEQQEERRKQELKDKKKKKVADDNQEAPLDDLSLKEIQLCPGQEITGYIWVGYPMNEAQVLELKESGVVFDKVLYLSDGVSLSEELPGEPGSIVSQRVKSNEISCVLEQELEWAENMIRVIKEQMGEELVKEVSIRGDREQVFRRVQNLIDPFVLRLDEDSNVRVSADLPETGYGHIPWGDYADFCPVSLEQGWLLQGKDEFECQVQQRRYRFYGASEL
jgi:adenylate kinase family enzyme